VMSCAAEHKLLKLPAKLECDAILAAIAARRKSGVETSCLSGGTS
jgi:hypothetical protein